MGRPCGRRPPARTGRPSQTPTGVHRAAGIASERRALRHTYISILLLVTDNLPYVMDQVGHGDQDTTNRIYRHLIRQRQEHGAAFDRVVIQAREAFGSATDRREFVG